MTVLRYLLALLLVVTALPAIAQDEPKVATVAAGLTQASAELQAIDDATVDARDDAARQALRTRAEAVQATAADAVRVLTPEMALVQARVAELGAATPGVVEAPEIRAQRQLLAQSQSALDSAIKRARLIGVEAKQQIDDIGAAEAEELGQKLSEKSASPLSPTLWTAIVEHLPRDTARLNRFVVTGVRQFAQHFQARAAMTALGGVLVALVLLIPLRRWLHQLGRRYVTNHAPGGRIRRSAYALWLVVIGTAVPGLAALAFVQSLRWSALLSPAWSQFGSMFVGLAFFAAFLSSLGGALLLRGQPSWRLLPIGDTAAQTLRPYTWAAAALVFVGQLLISTNLLIGASAAASTAANAVIALLHIALVGGVLVALARLRAAAQPDPEAPARNSLLAIVAMVVWLALLVALVAGLIGYVNLALKTGQWMLWGAIVGASLYLMMTFTDDACRTLLSSSNRIGRSANSGFGVGNRTVDQIGVLLSAFLRLMLIMLALGAVMAPFGANVGSVFELFGTVAGGVTIGEITISPGAVLRSLAVLFVALAIMRGLQHWLVNSYLPTTAMDPGAQNSVTMVARYAGIAAAVLWSLAALGIGMEKLAVVLGALSVGIGFGLQAITQNFVSGLILLAERPVKIGDWVRIGNQEGDVKRINVRSTEIQVADRSTLIVPNSELITKTIQNMTLAAPIGRIQLQFSVPLESDLDAVRTMLFKAFADKPEVLDDPEVKVFIDSVEGGRVKLNCFAYVASPRDTYPVRSDLLFTLLRQFREAGIDLGTTTTRMELVGSLPVQVPASGPGPAA
jgi:potassium efflux system protein